MTIFAANKKLTAVQKLFAAAGLDLEELLAANDENALKALAEVDPRDAQVDLLSAVGIAIKAGEDPAVVLKAALSAKDLACTVYTSGCELAGVKVSAADAKAGVTSADVKRAIEDRVSIAAGELTAKIGTRPLETAIKNGPATNDKQASYSEFQGMSPRQKKEFLRAGGQISDAPKL